MSVVLLALVAGLGLGRLAGGRFRHAAGTPIRALPLLLAGVVLRLAPEALDSGSSRGLLLGSALALVLFGGRNLHLIGMPIVVLGVALNTVPLVVDGGIPVRAEALVAIGAADSGSVASVDPGAGRHVATPDDDALAFGDVVPVSALGAVVSFGDLVLAVGVGVVACRLVRPPLRRRSRVRPVSTGLPTDVTPDAAPSDDGRLVDLTAPVDVDDGLDIDLDDWLPAGDRA